MVMPLIWLVAATTKGSDDLLHFTFFATQPAHLGPLQFYLAQALLLRKLCLVIHGDSLRALYAQ